MGCPGFAGPPRAGSGFLPGLKAGASSGSLGDLVLPPSGGRVAADLREQAMLGAGVQRGGGLVADRQPIAEEGHAAESCMECGASSWGRKTRAMTRLRGGLGVLE
ncbi:hypothetical protein Acsp04_48040 [Actinomadura sp. NBRC 104425]|nr:hypothetical protein Acsp04_48040 [Actinomadura sp. NBRC 104425]